MPEAPHPQGTPGPATDRRNEAVADPSPNVLDLVTASDRRQDDLRSLESRHVREILELRAEAGARDRKCGEEIAELTAKHNHEIADLRARHGGELRTAEADRINAIRAVDVAAAREESSAAEIRASTLAKQVSDAAEAMRTQVDAARVAASESQAVALVPIQTAIDSLRQAQYEQQGQKSQVAETRDAAAEMRPVLDAISNLQASQSEAQGQKTQVVETQARGGSTALWIGLGVAAAGVVIAAAGLLITILILVATQ